MLSRMHYFIFGMLIMLLACTTVAITPVLTETASPTETMTPTEAVIPTETPILSVTMTPMTQCVLIGSAFRGSYLYTNPDLTEILLVDGEGIWVTYMDALEFLESNVDDMFQRWSYKVRTVDGVVGWVLFDVLPAQCVRQ